MTSDTASPEAGSAELRDHPAVARSALNTAWPLAALALILLVLLRSCVPGAAPPGFDAARAAAQANEAALAALRALPHPAPTDDVAQALNLAVVNFASGSAEVPPGARGVLRAAARALAGRPAADRLRITGHTDNVGDAAANLALSLQRALAVRAVLIGEGVPDDTLLADGAGDRFPVAPNDSEANRFRNRRIEFAAVP